jgi:hypothetical protein
MTYDEAVAFLQTPEIQAILQAYQRAKAEGLGDEALKPHYEQLIAPHYQRLREALDVIWRTYAHLTDWFCGATGMRPEELGALANFRNN